MRNSIVSFGKVVDSRSYRGSDNVERHVATVKGEITIDFVTPEDMTGADVVVQIDSGKNGLVSRIIKVLD